MSVSGETASESKTATDSKTDVVVVVVAMELMVQSVGWSEYPDYYTSIITDGWVMDVVDCLRDADRAHSCWSYFGGSDPGKDSVLKGNS